MPFNAVQQVLSATRGAAHKVKVDEEPRKCQLIFPFVVTDAPLFEAWLDIRGELELKEVGASVVFFESDDSEFHSPPVVILTESGLTQSAPELRDMKGLCSIGEELVRNWERK